MSTFGIVLFWLGAICLGIQILRQNRKSWQWLDYLLFFVGLSAMIIGTGVIFLRFQG